MPSFRRQVMRNLFWVVLVQGLLWWTATEPRPWQVVGLSVSVQLWLMQVLDYLLPTNN